MTRTMKIGTLAIAYDDQVLEPRPWTVAQSQWAAELHLSLPDGPLLELCSGVGHIGLVAALLTGRDAVLVDANEVACRFAEANAETAGLRDRVEVRRGDMSSALDPHERFPLVLADPPYIPSSDIGRFPEDPVTAIDGGADGLEVARLCLAVAARHVHPEGVVLLQLRDTEQVDRLYDVDEPEHPALHVKEVRTVEGRGALVRLAATTSATRAGFRGSC
ncbi:MAG: methyltransferase domain-containing protein [Nocardioidaceae bacterium]|nr:methyltransferase domain-containing protein [Nocardioidaceae bacterium]